MSYDYGQGPAGAGGMQWPAEKGSPAASAEAEKKGSKDIPKEKAAEAFKSCLEHLKKEATGDYANGLWRVFRPRQFTQLEGGFYSFGDDYEIFKDPVQIKAATEGMSSEQLEEFVRSCPLKINKKYSVAHVVLRDVLAGFSGNPKLFATSAFKEYMASYAASAIYLEGGAAKLSTLLKIHYATQGKPEETIPKEIIEAIANQVKKLGQNEMDVGNLPETGHESVLISTDDPNVKHAIEDYILSRVSFDAENP